MGRHNCETTQPWDDVAMGMTQPWDDTAMGQHSHGMMQTWDGYITVRWPPWDNVAMGWRSYGMTQPRDIIAVRRHSHGTMQLWHNTVTEWHSKQHRTIYTYNIMLTSTTSRPLLYFSLTTVYTHVKRNKHGVIVITFVHSHGHSNKI